VTDEVWKQIPGYEGIYEVSDRGGVRSMNRLDARGRKRVGKPLAQVTASSGHKYVSLFGGGRRTRFGVHALVLMAFVGPRPPRHDACHWNDVPGDNQIENLRWGTRSDNRLDAVRNGCHNMASKTHCPYGHAYTPENTYHYPNGARACNECRRIYREEHKVERRMKNREYMRRKREGAKG